jgi:hypothetical protein
MPLLGNLFPAVMASHTQTMRLEVFGSVFVYLPAVAVGA